MRHLSVIGLLVSALAIAGCGGGRQSQRPVLAVHDEFVSKRYKSVVIPVVGETFSTDNGYWSRAVSSYTYQWEHCTGVSNGIGKGCSNASGSPSNQPVYKVAAGDSRDFLDVVITATFVSGGSASQRSLATGAVVASNVTWPASYTDGPLGQNEVLPARKGGVLLSLWTGVDDQGYTPTTERDLVASRFTDMGRTPVLMAFQCPPNVAGNPCSLDVNSSNLSENWVHSFGAIPFVTWSPDGTYTQITAGDKNAEIDTMATRMKTFGHRVMLRLFSEFNDGGMGSWSPTDFVAAWRYIVTRFQSDGATNVGWVWNSEERASPLTGCTTSDECYYINQSYPGDAYVDWVSTDHYNRDFNGSSSPDAPGWAEFGELFNYTKYISVEQHWGPEKPFFVAETGSFYDTPGVPAGHVVDPNRKANWFRNIETSAAQMPYLIGVDFFDQDPHTQEPGVNFRVDSPCDSSGTHCADDSTDQTTYQGFLDMSHATVFNSGVAGGAS